MKIKYEKLLSSWKGSNYFWCNGRALTGGQSIKPILFTSLMLSLPIALFLSFNYSVYTHTK